MKKFYILFALSLTGCIFDIDKGDKFYCEQVGRYSFGRQCLDNVDKCHSIYSGCVEYKVVFCANKVVDYHTTTACLASNEECEALVSASNKAYDKCFMADYYDVNNPEYVRDIP